MELILLTYPPSATSPPVGEKETARRKREECGHRSFFWWWDRASEAAPLSPQPFFLSPVAQLFSRCLSITWHYVLFFFLPPPEPLPPSRQVLPPHTHSSLKITLLPCTLRSFAAAAAAVAFEVSPLCARSDFGVVARERENRSIILRLGAHLAHLCGTHVRSGPSKRDRCYPSPPPACPDTIIRF